MTLAENTPIIKESYKSPSNRFDGMRGYNTLGDIVVGCEFVIPENYIVMNKPVIFNGKNLLDHNGKPVLTQYIECKDSFGGIIEFYPASLFQVAFIVDEYGHNIRENGRMKFIRSNGPLVDYANRIKDVNIFMQNIKGCKVKLINLEIVPVRTFGIEESAATTNDIEMKKIGTWTLVGELRPKDWSE